jgi:outer membrane lipoprotein SlyB
MNRSLMASLGVAFLLGGCVTQQPWTPTIDTYGGSRNQFVHQDMHECRQLALRVSGSAPEEAARGAVTGGLVGAAGGAALGAALGNAGRGAAIGAAAGGVGLGATRAAQSEAAFKRAFNDCMRGRGHNVIG